jgi:hypothetical protein
MSKPIFQLSRVSGQPVSDAELLADLRRVAEFLTAPSVSRPQYIKLGKYGATTIHARFSSWNKALVAAGLSVAHENDIPDERLFENLLALWQHYGRQPRRNELAHAPSKISQGPYNRRFGSWTAALETFANYANESGVESATTQSSAESTRRLTGRAPSLRLRWHVLQRDHFSCRACGATPALTPGVELHVDHVVPWSKGGETVMENLQTLCSICNLGKSNV